MADRIPLDARSWPLIRRLLAEHVRPHWRTLALAGLFMAVVAAATAATAKLIEPVLDEVFAARSADLLWPLAGAVLAAFLVKAAAMYAHGVLMNRVGQRIVADLQLRLARSLIAADLAFHQSRPTGTLVSRFTTDAGMLKQAVSNSLTAVGRDALTLAALVGVMFWQDWGLSLAVFIVFPLAALPADRMGRAMRRLSRRAQEETGRLTARLDQILQNIRQVKADGREGFEQDRAGTAIEELFRIADRAGRVRGLNLPVNEALGGLAVAGAIAYGGATVVDGTRTTGAFFSFITALLLAYEPLKRLSQTHVSLQEGLAAAERLFELIDVAPAVRPPAAPVPLPAAGFSVGLEGVTFAYPGAERPALDGLDLAAPEGATLALVGPSGAGKSTILGLIPRFFDVDAGRVTVAGVDVRALAFAELRRSMALVSQDPILFDDTVRANVAYARPEADDAAVRRALDAAAALEFAMALPHGLDTRIGERGVTLSGGQRQRLAIARAILKDAPILLLDEATSALDSESERLVQDALARLRQGRTVIVVAHRLATIASADRIAVIEQGRVAELGGHAELLAARGVYARLCALQFGAAA